MRVLPLPAPLGAKATLAGTTNAPKHRKMQQSEHTCLSLSPPHSLATAPTPPKTCRPPPTLPSCIIRLTSDPSRPVRASHNPAACSASIMSPNRPSWLMGGVTPHLGPTGGAGTDTLCTFSFAANGYASYPAAAAQRLAAPPFTFICHSWWGPQREAAWLVASKAQLTVPHSRRLKTRVCYEGS